MAHYIIHDDNEFELEMAELMAFSRKELSGQFFDSENRRIRHLNEIAQENPDQALSEFLNGNY